MTDGKKPETPRTDALTLRMSQELGKPMLERNHIIDLCTHSRKLEADLIAAQKELEEQRLQQIEHDTLGCAMAKTGIYAEQALALRGEPVAWLVEHSPDRPCYGDRRYVTLMDATKPAFWIGSVIPEGDIVTPLYAAPISGERATEDRVVMLERALQSKDAFACVADPIPCLICINGESAQQLWFVPKGCICSDNPVQALCLQHVKTLEPISGASFIAHIATVAEPAVSGERVREALAIAILWALENEGGYTPDTEKYYDWAKAVKEKIPGNPLNKDILDAVIALPLTAINGEKNG